MNLAVLRFTILAVACLGIGGCASPPTGDDIEAHLWDLEQQYITTFQEGDIDGLFRFWHPQFAGWPSHSAVPLELKDARASSLLPSAACARPSTKSDRAEPSPDLRAVAASLLRPRR